MDLPKSAEAKDLKDSKELWENLSLYILNDNEGTIRKLPFRLENYSQVGFGQVTSTENDGMKTPSFEASRRSKSPKKQNKTNCSNDQRGRRNSNVSPRMMASIMISNFDKIKEYNLLTPTSRRSRNGSMWQDESSFASVNEWDQGSSSNSSAKVVPEYHSTKLANLLPAELKKDRHTALRYISYGLSQRNCFKLKINLSKFENRKVNQF